MVVQVVQAVRVVLTKSLIRDEEREKAYLRLYVSAYNYCMYLSYGFSINL